LLPVRGGGRRLRGCVKSLFLDKGRVGDGFEVILSVSEESFTNPPPQAVPLLYQGGKKFSLLSPPLERLNVL